MGQDFPQIYNILDLLVSQAQLPAKKVAVKHGKAPRHTWISRPSSDLLAEQFAHLSQKTD